MEFEIERKWLVPTKRKTAVMDEAASTGVINIRQSYFSHEARVRISNNDAILCIKRRVTLLTAKEFNYQIPKDEAEELLEDMDVITKQRYTLGDDYTLDVFADKLEGLILVEKEFDSELSAANAQLPSWLEGCPEVTGNAAYHNENLGKTMFVEGVGIVGDQNLVTGDEEEVELAEFVIR